MAAVCTTYVFTSASVRSFGTALAAVSILLETSRGRSDQIPADCTANAMTNATFLGCCRRSHFRMGAQKQQDPRTQIPRSVNHICAEQISPQHSQLAVGAGRKLGSGLSAGVSHALQVSHRCCDSYTIALD